MVAYFNSYSAKLLPESGYFDSLNPFSSSYSGDFNGVLSGGSMPIASEALVPAGKVGKKGVSVAEAEAKAKARAALKSHSEAERRRRERINAHLDTLRGLVPCKEKMDKATLLAEVVKEVKELKKNAMKASQGFLIPMDDDKVQVEPFENSPNGTFSYKASICCEYRSELLSDIRQAIEALQLKLENTEISTLGGRIKILLLLTSCTNKHVAKDADAQNLLVNSIQKALNSVLEKCSFTPVYSPRTTLPNKRMRLAYFDSPGSSS